MMLKLINVRQFIFQLILFILLTGSIKVSAQLSVIHDYRRIDSVLLIIETNDTLQYPFAGGLNSCQFMNMDINLDGTDDLLVFDRHGDRILPFIVLPSTPLKFRFAPEFITLFPPVAQWMQAIDYNRDGKKDIFTYTTGGIKVYRNDSENALKFIQVTSPFLLSLHGTTLTNILVTYADYPAIVDIDGDGDLDVLTFWGLGSFVEWHKNTSVERFGNADSLTFVKVSSCWGRFAESNEDNIIILDTCAAGGPKNTSTHNSNDPKHTGSTILVHDLNADGLFDITLGDVDFSTLIHLTNGGTPADARMISQTTDFPNAKDPVKMYSFPAAMLVDVNNDGRKDLLVSPFEPSLSKGENYNSVSLYLNNGTISNPVFSLVSKHFLQDQMLDFGSGSYPVLFDYNNDGLMDILVGNFGYSDTCIYTPATGLQCSFTSKIALLINEGTATKPQYRITGRDIANLAELEMQSLLPSVADMDGDGDMDLVCGNSKGKFVYCDNSALPGQPADFKMVDPAWHNIDVGDFSAPQLFDIDQDGLTDMISGKRKGTLSFYKNTGTKQVAQFTLISDLFGGVDVTNTQLSNGGYSVPYFYKDKQGDIKLFVGSEFGEVFVYDQISNNLDGNFRLLGTLPGIKEGWRSGVAISNLNNDTLTDMLVGNYSGGLGLFYGKPDKVFGINERNSFPVAKLFVTPNPAVDQVSVSVKSDLIIKPESLEIKSMDGKIVRKYVNPELPFVLNVSGLTDGIYLVYVRTNQRLFVGKLAICR